MKFRTIDIEGDGNTTINKRLFPDGNHFDPDTIMWCITFCDQDYNTLTLVKKLPPETRVINGVTGKGKTNSYHEITTVIPKVIDNHEIIEFTDWNDYLKEITWQIMISDGDIYSKGYGKYNYDAMVLKANYERNNIYDGVSKLIKSVNPTKWDKTFEQVKNYRVPNQEFTERGIKHNIEDAIQLAQRINNKEIK
jgi:hypothetical protein